MKFSLAEYIKKLLGAETLDSSMITRKTAKKINHKLASMDILTYSGSGCLFKIESCRIRKSLVVCGRYFSPFITFKEQLFSIQNLFVRKSHD